MTSSSSSSPPPSSSSSSSSSTTLDKLVHQTKQQPDWADQDLLVNQIKTHVLLLDQQNVARHWAKLIPVILQLCSHFIHKVTGLHLLHHLLRNATPDLISRNSVDQLLLYHLRKMFYQQEVDVYDQLFPTLQLLCSKCPPQIAPGDRPIPMGSSSSKARNQAQSSSVLIEPTTSSSHSTTSELDQIMQIVMDALQLSSDDQFRLCTVRRLPLLYPLLGDALLKHLQRLLKLHGDLLNVELGIVPNRLELVEMSLISLRSIIELTREHGDTYLREVLELLVKLAYGLQDAPTGRSFTRRLSGCLCALRSINSIRFDQLLQVASQIEELRIEKLNLESGVDEMNFERV